MYSSMYATINPIPINHLFRSSPFKFSSFPLTKFPRKTSTSSSAAIHAKISSSAPSVLLKGNKPESSLYDVLRIKRNVSLIDIKKAYRNLAKLYHPDSLSDQADIRNFMAICDAYATLSDPTARALYDMSIGVGQGSGLRIGNLAGSGYRHGWRWETDQCW
ncbi:unnamed protein product [Rhodiola kirilowii]